MKLLSFLNVTLCLLLCNEVLSLDNNLSSVKYSLFENTTLKTTNPDARFDQELGASSSILILDDHVYISKFVDNEGPLCEAMAFILIGHMIRSGQYSDSEINQVNAYMIIACLFAPF